MTTPAMAWIRQRAGGRTSFLPSCKAGLMSWNGKRSSAQLSFAPLPTPLSKGSVRRYLTSRSPPLCAMGHSTIPPAASTTAGMDGYTDVRYNTAADAFMERLECKIDELNHEAIEEVNSSAGVLTIETEKHGSFVLNKQAPKLQLWLSSPVSGPHHYDMVPVASKTTTSTSEDSVEWICDQDKHNLRERLAMELKQVLQIDVEL